MSGRPVLDGRNTLMGIEMSEPVLLGSQGRPDASPGSWAPFEELPVPVRYRLAPDGISGGTGFNVAPLFAAIASDLCRGAAFAPDFADALCRHELLAAIERGEETGVRQTVRY